METNTVETVRAFNYAAETINFMFFAVWIGLSLYGFIKLRYKIPFGLILLGEVFSLILHIGHLSVSTIFSSPSIHELYYTKISLVSNYVAVSLLTLGFAALVISMVKSPPNKAVGPTPES